MKALQYLYTSWPNGNLPNKGYMIYSTSEGITPEECEDIRRVMRYQPPLSLVPIRHKNKSSMSFRTILRIFAFRAEDCAQR